MEDLDAPRTVPGAADDMLETLEALGFEWDGAVVSQSARTHLYAEALARLEAGGHVFACTCSRSELAASQRPAGAAEVDELFYPGTCRETPHHRNRPHALRFRVPPREVAFVDDLQGPCTDDVSHTIGDFIVRRRDGLFAYQLAVVVDDAEQGINQVVRGCDLLSSTSRQLLLHEALQLAVPSYMHLPLLVEPGGEKLAKSRRSVPVHAEAPVLLMHSILRLLAQTPPAELVDASLAELWSWAVRHWNPEALRGVRQIELDPI
jgi:glutamyl-Q tRNA(Asp) synthetase